ncbi:MAG: nuclear transport factor 2 family protein [Dokdonella sp.]|uniref:YybH family protein n=1 Tax=Dokdonella sp. TaxID=2291710 RepID=UPI0025C655F0|nr:nuclear transport factor 2 family protein [Dokdonella sp.]MBZ0222142.1 nuclear transport factor 2 family protein [Dokdonella sp.]MCC7254621.1 nuclear transport factor 2 family protein [Dokdonella sp.]
MRQFGWFCVLLALLLGACARTSDEDAIRAAIERGAQGLQARDAGALGDLVSADFIGNDEIDRAQLANYLRGHFVVARTIEVRIGSIDIEIKGDRATARFDAFVSDSSGRWIPDRATTLQFTTGWRRSGGEWLCNNAQWSNDGQ